MPVISFTPYHRQGGNTFVGAGYGSWTGVVLIEFISIANVMMLGEYITIDGKKGGEKEEEWKA